MRPATAAVGGDFVPARYYNYTVKMNGARSREANVAMLNTRDLRWTK